MINFVIHIIVISESILILFGESEQFNDYGIECEVEGIFAQSNNKSYIVCTKKGNEFSAEIKYCKGLSTFNEEKKKCIRKLPDLMNPTDPTNYVDYEIECGVEGNFPGPENNSYISCLKLDDGEFISIMRYCNGISTFDKDKRKCVRTITPEDDNSNPSYKCKKEGNFPGPEPHKFVTCTKINGTSFSARLKTCKGNSEFDEGRGKCIRKLKSYEFYDYNFENFKCERNGKYSGPDLTTYILCRKMENGTFFMTLEHCKGNSTTFEKYLGKCILNITEKLKIVRKEFNKNYTSKIGSLCFWKGWYCGDCFTLLKCQHVLLKNVNYRNQIVEEKRCHKRQVCSNFHLDCVNNPYEMPHCIGRYKFGCTSEGFFPNPYDCRKFYYCEKRGEIGIPTVCNANNNYYDVMDGRCHHFEKDFKPDSCPPTVPCRKQNQTFVLSRNKMFYYKCIKLDTEYSAFNVRMYKCEDYFIYSINECVLLTHKINSDESLSVIAQTELDHDIFND